MDQTYTTALRTQYGSCAYKCYRKCKYAYLSTNSRVVSAMPYSVYLGIHSSATSECQVMLYDRERIQNLKFQGTSFFYFSFPGIMPRSLKTHRPSRAIPEQLVVTALWASVHAFCRRNHYSPISVGHDMERFCQRPPAVCSQLAVV
jgi:hypothetical protein